MLLQWLYVQCHERGDFLQAFVFDCSVGVQTPQPGSVEIPARRGTQRYLVADKPQSSCQPKEKKEDFLLLNQQKAQLCAKGYLRCNADVTHLQGMTTPQWTGCTTRVTQAPPECKNSTKVS